MPAKKNTAKPRRSTATPASRRPRILVLEAAGGAAANAVMRSGALAIRVSPRDITKVEQALDAPFDGLLLTGGGDVDPRLYGQKPSRNVYGVSETRDYCEWVALDEAHKRKVPIMGICRGMQLIAVHNGGVLRQHVEGHRGGSHPVKVEDGSAFGVVVGDPAASYPSLHHQVVSRFGNTEVALRVGARSREGYIEAIEGGRLGRSGPRVLAVQFHPEYDYGSNEASRRLFDWLAQASARKARLPKPKRVPPKVVATPKRAASLVEQPWQIVRPGTIRRSYPPRHRVNPVVTRWHCRDCGMLFDRQQDREDHEYWLHGSPEVDVTEPPPGHPDWMEASS